MIQSDPVMVDPRLSAAVVDLTADVAEVAASLMDAGMTAEADRLLGALDRLDDG